MVLDGNLGPVAWTRGGMLPSFVCMGDGPAAAAEMRSFDPRDYVAVARLASARSDSRSPACPDKKKPGRRDGEPGEIPGVLRPLSPGLPVT
jgi:hypothetical protein